MKRIDIAPSAGRDLQDIWDYIASDSMDAADRVIAKIRLEFQRLADRPRVGHARAELDDFTRSGRFILTSSFIDPTYTQSKSSV